MTDYISELDNQISDMLDFVTDAALTDALDSDLPFVGDAFQTALLGSNPFLDQMKVAIAGALSQLAPGTSALDIAAAISKIAGVQATANGADITIKIVATETMDVTATGFNVDFGSQALGLKVGADADLDLQYKINLTLNYNINNQILKTGGGAQDVSLHLGGTLDVHGDGALELLTVDVSNKVAANPELNFDFNLDIANNKQVSLLGVADVKTTVSGSADLKLGLVTELPSAVLPTLATDLNVHFAIAPGTIASALSGLGDAPDIGVDNIQLNLGTFVQFLASAFSPIVDKVFGSFPLGPVLDVLTAPIPIIDPATRALGLIDWFDEVGNDGIINLLDIAVIGGADEVVINNFAIAFNLIQAIKHAKGGDSPTMIDLGTLKISGDLAGNPNQQPGNLPIPGHTFLAAANPLAAVQAALQNIFDTKSGSEGGLGGGPVSLLSVFEAAGVKIDLLTDPKGIIGLLFPGLGHSPDTNLISYKVPELFFKAEYNNFFPIIGPIGVAIGGSLTAGISVNFGYDTHGIVTGGGFEDGFYFSTDKMDKKVIDTHTLTFAPVATVGVEIHAAASVNIGFAEISIGGGVGANLSAFFPHAEFFADDPNAINDGKARLSDISHCLFSPIAGTVNALLFLHFSIDFGFFSFEHRFDLADITLAEFSFGCDSPETDEGMGLASLFTSDNPNALSINGGERAGQHSINGHAGEDGSESFEIRNAHNGDGLIANALEVTSRTVKDAPYEGGAHQITSIFARMGDERDVVVVAEDVTVAADIEGGAGDDLLVGGMGNDSLLGENGFDHLIGGKGNDTIKGGNDDDLIEGGEGADDIDGGDEIDQASYEHSKAGVKFTVDDDDSDIFHGKGGDAQGDTLTNIEYIIGSHFSDVLHTNPDEDGIIEALDGNDVLIGGSGKDYLIGGAGADALIGGSSEDGTSYLTSAGNVVVNLSTGKGTGGDAQGDTYDSIEDVQGSAGDDVITGNSMNNIIDGWYGDDQIASGGGNDTLTGGAGSDTIFGAAGNRDELDGGGGRASADRDLLSYERAGQGVEADLYGEDNPNEETRLNGEGDDDIVRVLFSSTKTSEPGEEDTYKNVYHAHISTFEDLTGSNFEDTLRGDDQYNVIRGRSGADLISGMGGNDTLVGGTGADTLDGGLGVDLADYRDSTGGVSVNLMNHQGIGAHAEGDVIHNIENVRGSDYRDILTGDLGDNELDAGLTNSTQADSVSGGLGTDTLVVDYSRGGNTKGMVGGFALNMSDNGSFVREENGNTNQRDGVSFNTVERIVVTGTAHDDVIFGALGNDYISTGSGNDVVFSGLGVDRVFTGKGNDVVVSGTGVDRQLSGLGGMAPVELVGGAGIDGLSISLAASTENIVLAGTSGLGDYNGINLALKNGTGISQFEVLFAVATGIGDDTISQPGVFDNFFATGFGVDKISSGLGADFVDGGLDYRIGSEIKAPDASGVLVPINSIKELYANNGDLLVLDYSGQAAAAIGSVSSAQSGISVLDGSIARAVQTNSGHYAAGTNAVDFSNIERLDVTGSSANDLLVGTDLQFGRNVYTGGELVSSKSSRGDDVLKGGDGTDLLIGNTGDDDLQGGKGDDVLVGAAVGSGRGAVVDLGEIDHLTGGAGADTFVLGTVGSSQNAIVYYNDIDISSGPFAVIGNHFASGDNHAIITDFQGEDFLQLAGIRSNYRAESVGGNTFIYLRDGIDAGGAANAQHDELIAELHGVAEFNLSGANVKYVGTAAQTNGAQVAGSEVQSAMMQLGGADEQTQSIVNRLAALATSDEIVARTEPVMSQAMLVKPVSVPVAGQSLSQPSWVTQTDDIGTLQTALFGSKSALSTGEMTLEGDASAFGTFNGDPFGLGHGIVLSTGAVEDLAGVNLIDGGKKLGASTELVFVKIGRVGNSDIFRADLSNIGFDLNSIRLGDQSAGFGGGGGIASGFDISAIALSTQRLNDLQANDKLDDPSFFQRIDAFSFDAANASFTPGHQRPADINFPNGTDLRGSINGLPMYQDATLDKFDDGRMSLGDGGSLGLNLTQTVSTDGPLYLYVAEYGATGEELTTGFTASSDRLNTPADLSTDLGAPGEEGDSVSLTYRFNTLNTKNPDPSLTKVTFDFVFFSEELVEYAQSEFNDNFKITLNGVNLALLTDGSTASINTLYTPNASGTASSNIFTLREDTIVPDFIYNPAGTGPTAGQTRADGYSKVLHFTGDILYGVENVLKFEVNDVRDGLLDSGILIRGGSLVGATTNAFHIDQLTAPIAEGSSQVLNFGLTIPPGNHSPAPVTVTFRPSEGLDLGAGAGNAVTKILNPNGVFADTITAAAVADGLQHAHHFETIDVELSGPAGMPEVAPLVVEVTDTFVTIERTLGDAATTLSNAAPNAWADAWTAEGVHITHTADGTAAAPVYSAVVLGTLDRSLLSGGDLYRGDLGVSGRAPKSLGNIQDITGKEALRFDFDSKNVSAFSLEFGAFGAGDVANIELLDSKGAHIRTYSSNQATFDLEGRQGIASIIVTAQTGGFLVHSLTVAEDVDVLLAQQMGFVTGTNGNDTLTGGTAVDMFHGLGGNDILSGFGGNDNLYGDGGNDALRGGLGNDLLDGGMGIDTADYSDASAGVKVSLAIAAAQVTGGGGTDKLVSIENLTGSAFGDTLSGDGLDNYLRGLSGKDMLYGGVGNDILSGGLGADTFSGGAGSDIFLFDTLGTAADKDTIKDFTKGADQIALARFAFSGFMGHAAGALTAADIAFGKAATTATQHLVYNSGNGNLYYDADGFGGAA